MSNEKTRTLIIVNDGTNCDTTIYYFSSKEARQRFYIQTFNLDKTVEEVTSLDSFMYIDEHEGHLYKHHDRIRYASDSRLFTDTEEHDLELPKTLEEFLEYLLDDTDEMQIGTETHLSFHSVSAFVKEYPPLRGEEKETYNVLENDITNGYVYLLRFSSNESRYEWYKKEFHLDMTPEEYSHIADHLGTFYINEHDGHLYTHCGGEVSYTTWSRLYSDEEELDEDMPKTLEDFKECLRGDGCYFKLNIGGGSGDIRSFTSTDIYVD